MKPTLITIVCATLIAVGTAHWLGAAETPNKETPNKQTPFKRVPYPKATPPPPAVNVFEPAKDLAPTEEEIERAARDHDDMLVREIERALAARDPQRRETVFTFLLPELLQFDPARVVEMVKRQEPGEARDALRTEVARHWIMRDVDATVGWMKSLPNEAERRDAAVAAVSTLSAFAPDQAIAVAEEFGVGRQDGYLEHLAQIWAESDLPAAEAWAHSQRDNPQSAPLRARIDAVRVAQSHRGDDRGDDQ
jgi:hypothetical protein